MLIPKENELINLVKQAQKRWRTDSNTLDKNNLANSSFLLMEIIEKLIGDGLIYIVTVEDFEGQETTRTAYTNKEVAQHEFINALVDHTWCTPKSALKYLDNFDGYYEDMHYIISYEVLEIEEVNNE